MTRIDASIEKLYRERGAVVVRDALDPAALELLLAGIARNLLRPSKNHLHYPGEGGRGAFTGDFWSWKWIPEYIEFVKTSGLAEMAARLLGAKRVFFLEDNYFIKQPGSTITTPWHQDFPYFAIDGEFCSAWIPLDPHPRDEALRFVAGSHRLGKLFMPVDFDPEATPTPPELVPAEFTPVPEIDAHPGDHEILAWEVAPGDCVFFDGRTLHGSRGNAGEAPRRRFIDESATHSQRDYPWSNFAETDVARGEALWRDSENFPLVWKA